MKKFGKKIALATALVMALTGCSSDTPETTSPVETTPVVESEVTSTPVEGAEGAEEAAAGTIGNGEEITIRTVSQFGATDPAYEVYAAAIEAFQEKYPNVTVTDESATVDEPWKAKIKADFAVGNEPDVILYFTDANSHELIESGSFVDVETIRAEFPEYVDHIYPHTYTTAPDGKQYAVPTRGFYEAMFVNKDLFDQYELELPTDWDKLMTAVETFAANDIIPFAASFADVPHYMIEHLVLAAGGIEDHSAVPATAEEIPASWVTAMEQFKVLFDAGAFPEDVNATTNPLVNELFHNKQAAMVIDGSWFNGQVKDTENVVAMPFPSMTEADSNSLVAGFTAGWYISSKGWEDENKRDVLVEFVETVSSPEFLGAITAVAPCDIEAKTDMTNLDTTAAETYTNAGANINLPIDSRVAGEAWSAWTTAIGPIAEGEQDPLEALTNVVEILNAE